MGKSNNRNNTSPEPVPSSGNNTASDGSATKFNEQDYRLLHERYLQPRLRRNAVLAGGMTLRRQTKSRVIDNHPKGLAAKIDALDKKGRREEIYEILVSLREWDLDPKKVPKILRNLSSSGRTKSNRRHECEDDENSINDSAVCEFVDLSREEKVTTYINIDDIADGSNSCEEFEWDEHTTIPERIPSRVALNAATTNIVALPECTPSGRYFLISSMRCDNDFIQVTHAFYEEILSFASKIEMDLSNRMFYRKKERPCSLGGRGAFVGSIKRSRCSSKSTMLKMSRGSKLLAKKTLHTKVQRIEFEQQPVECQSNPFSVVFSRESENRSVANMSNQDNSPADNVSRGQKEIFSYGLKKAKAASVASAKNIPARVGETITNSATSGTICESNTSLFDKEPNPVNNVMIDVSKSFPLELSEPVAQSNCSQTNNISVNNMGPLYNTLIYHSESCNSGEKTTATGFGKCTSVQIQEAVHGMIAFHESIDHARYPISSPRKGTDINVDIATTPVMDEENCAVKRVVDLASVDYERYQSDDEGYGSNGVAYCECEEAEVFDEKSTKDLIYSSTTDATDVLAAAMNTPLTSTGAGSVGFKASENLQETEEIRRMRPTNLNERFQLASAVSRSPATSRAIVTPNEDGKSYSSFVNFPEDGNGNMSKGEVTGNHQSTVRVKSVVEYMQHMSLSNQSKGFGKGKSDKSTPISRLNKKKSKPYTFSTKEITTYFGVAREKKPQMPRNDSKVSSMSIASRRLNRPSNAKTEAVIAQNHQHTTKAAETSQNQGWLHRYSQLKEYRNKNGHCLVPVTWPCHPALGTWVSNQRFQYKLNQHGKKSCLTRERINLLNELGFVWRAKPGRRDDHKPVNKTLLAQKDWSKENKAAQSKNENIPNRHMCRPSNGLLPMTNKIMKDHSNVPTNVLQNSGCSDSSSKEMGRSSFLFPIVGEMRPTFEGLQKSSFQISPHCDTRHNSSTKGKCSDNISIVNIFSPTSSKQEHSYHQQPTVLNPFKPIITNGQLSVQCNTKTPRYSNTCQVDRKSNGINQIEQTSTQANAKITPRRFDFFHGIRGSSASYPIDTDSDTNREAKLPLCGRIWEQDTSTVLQSFSEASPAIQTRYSRVANIPNKFKNESIITNTIKVKRETTKREGQSSYQPLKLRLETIGFGFPPTVSPIAKKSRIMYPDTPMRTLITQIPFVGPRAKIKPLNQSFHITRSETNLQHVSTIGRLKRNLFRVDTNKSFPVVPSYRTKRSFKFDLANEWRTQSRKRRKGKWLPSGGWRPPHWAPPLQDKRGRYLSNHEKRGKCRSVATKQFGCRKTLLPRLEALMNNFTSLLVQGGITSKGGNKPADNDKPNSLSEVIYPEYLEPSVPVLKTAHLMIQDLLPKGDCECFEVIKIARTYYDHWRPARGKTKVIVLAESHAFTERARALKGPGLERSLLQDTYLGPREFISLVYCLAYGENEALSRESTDPKQNKENKGTPQFWALLAACSRGVDFVPDIATNANTKNVRARFATDVLKGGGLPVEDRLKAKVEILKDLQRRGIWLLDASIFGWYISQPQEYNRSVRTNEIHRKAKSRPPKDLKAPSLVLSWELFTKHVIRDVANEGGLKLLIPIGMEVEASLTRSRLEDAISTEPKASVADTFPAPNAWIPGGYGPFHAKLAELVHEVAPRVVECKEEHTSTKQCN